MVSAFIPSSEQQAILDFIQEGSGNLLVRARAGTGKTSTILEAIKRTPNCRGIYCAFNTSIRDEMEPKLKGTHVSAKTFHQLGRSSLIKEIRISNPSVNGGQYRKHAEWWLQTPEAKAAWDEVLHPDRVPAGNQEKYMKNQTKHTKRFISDLTNFLRLKLVDWEDTEGLKGLIRFYYLDQEIDSVMATHVIPAIPQIMKYAESEVRLGRIDFTDMIYWIYRWNLSIPQYDWVFIDEAQDLNPMQRDMVRRAVKPNGRAIVIGDDRQAIYGFAGADSDSLDLSQKEFNTSTLPMTVTRRCGTVITHHAAQIVRDFKALDTAARGKIIWWPEGRMRSVVEAGDLVISRIKAPLVSACLNLIVANKPATILGTEIGRSLVGILERIAEGDGFSFYELSKHLAKYEEVEVKKALAKDDEQQVENIKDTVAALRVLNERIRAKDMDTLCAEILKLFTDDKERNGLITLCTAHKSKGLEADRVFILSPDKLPLTLSNAPAEIQAQESNLEYVTITRAKKVLVYLTNDKFLEENMLIKPPYVQDTFDDLEWIGEKLESKQAEAPDVIEGEFTEERTAQADNLLPAGEQATALPPKPAALVEKVEQETRRRDDDFRAGDEVVYLLTGEVWTVITAGLSGVSVKNADDKRQSFRYRDLRRLDVAKESPFYVEDSPVGEKADEPEAEPEPAKALDVKSVDWGAWQLPAGKAPSHERISKAISKLDTEQLRALHAILEDAIQEREADEPEAVLS